MTTVSAGITYKRSLGNYENITVHCSVTDEPRVIGGKEETVSEAWERVYSFCEKKVEAKIKEIDKDAG